MNEFSLREFEKLKKVVMDKILSKEARERLGRVRMVKPELALQVEVYLIKLYQAGRIKNLISDEEMKKILEQFSRGKEYKILK